VQYDQQWGLGAINAAAAYTPTPTLPIGASGAGIVVGVLDTGVQLNNPELTTPNNDISPLSTDVVTNPISGQPRDQPNGVNLHATWVSDVIAGEFTGFGTLGVAYQATILSVRADDFEVGHRSPEPLQTYRVDVRARAQSYADPSALLRGEPGTPVEMTMNLVWATDGTPYTYRVTTRYEIPCTVSGTVTVDGTRYDVDAVPGQRDHSWGVRDWWSMDWIWSALHLDDGTHLHGVNIRIPGTPSFSVGYAQDADGNVTELHTVESREAFAPNGLPRNATVVFNPGGITADVDVCGQAPVRLPAEDGSAFGERTGAGHHRFLVMARQGAAMIRAAALRTVAVRQAVMHPQGGIHGPDRLARFGWIDGQCGSFHDVRGSVSQQHRSLLSLP